MKENLCKIALENFIWEKIAVDWCNLLHQEQSFFFRTALKITFLSWRKCKWKVCQVNKYFLKVVVEPSMILQTLSQSWRQGNRKFNDSFTHMPSCYPSFATASKYHDHDRSRHKLWLNFSLGGSSGMKINWSQSSHMQ